MTRRRSSRSILSLLAVAALPWLVAGPVAAQEQFPNRPLTIVNPFPPGGQADLTGRPLAAALERVLKQPVLLTNKPGAAGAVGMQSVAIAKPDGYTIVITVPAISTLPEVDQLFGRPSTFARTDFAPIARINADPTILVVNAELPYKDVKELLADARKRPNEIVYATSGIYGASHVPTEMLLHAAGGLKMRHLPTTGGGPATTAVLGNHAAFWMSTTGPAAPHVKSGKFRALAVSGATRHPHYPDVPTLKELGYDVEYYLWIGLFAPKNTPPAVMTVWRDAVRKAMQDPEFKSGMDKIQVPPAYQDADEFRAWWDADAARLADVIKKIGKVDVK
ncbi:MAG TPA: tripartite tricarboxylate transporter substrate binding protein [Methylomirabilota bacterium]|jgi:tripartite-type tricarboxylate transporter receptor subunit TctC|nr:tripartite tricarboxylate transporter substrate binding protein [Methylomirabilota bacterium]